MNKPKRGGPNRNQGRKPVKPGEDTITVSLRMTPAQREKLARLGGAEWVRGRIDRARETWNGTEINIGWRRIARIAERKTNRTHGKVPA